eukprot:s2383_g10.t1
MCCGAPEVLRSAAKCCAVLRNAVKCCNALRSAGGAVKNAVRRGDKKGAAGGVLCAVKCYELLRSAVMYYEVSVVKRCKVLCRAVKCCQVLRSAAKCCKVLRSAARCCEVLRNAVKCCDVLRGAVKCCEMP